MRPLEEGQKVFGIGLSKTGTTSLAKALNLAGVKTIHFPHDARTFDELKRGVYRLSILERFQGVTDTPVAPFFAQLDSAWPGSKFILTIRDKASWLRSAENHWQVVLEELRSSRPDAIAFVDFINACVYGTTYFSAERFSYVYDTHVSHVERYFASRPDDLLIYDICSKGGDWGALCEFLGRHVNPDVPFPHAYPSNGVIPGLAAARAELAQVAVPGSTAIVLDQEELGSELTGSICHRRPFPEENGGFWGFPPDSESAIAHLERQRGETAAEFLVVAWPGFWWLDYYSAFAAHVRSRYRCVLQNERLIVWSLRG